MVGRLDFWMIFTWSYEISERKQREYHPRDIITVMHLHIDTDGMIVEEDGQEVILGQGHIPGHHQDLARGDTGGVTVIANLL